MIEQFVFFQGIPGKETVSQAIEVILVPDKQMKACAEKFIAEHPEAFRTGGPDVHVFRNAPGAGRPGVGMTDGNRRVQRCRQFR
jgi:hypothetical protein